MDLLLILIRTLDYSLATWVWAELFVVGFMNLKVEKKSFELFISVRIQKVSDLLRFYLHLAFHLRTLNLLDLPGYVNHVLVITL